MDFKQIDAFVNVAKYKSFSKAAEAIYLSQPTVSAHIASLEEELNKQLFDRHGKDVRLTPAGILFLEYAINMINMRNNAILNLSELDKKIVGNLTIATSTVPLRTILPKLLTTYHSIYQEITFDIKETSTKKVIDMLLSGEVDLGFVGEIIPDEKLSYTKIKKDALVLVSNNEALPDILSIDDIMQLPFIIRENGSATRHIIDNFIKSLGYSIDNMKLSAVVNSLETVLQLVKSGFGISIVSETACNDYISAGYIRKHELLLPDSKPILTQEFYIITYLKRTMTPLAKSFLSHTLDYFSL